MFLAAALCGMLLPMSFAYDIAEAVRSGQRSAVEVIQEALARADVAQTRLNAFITIAADEALSRAHAIDAKRAAGEPLGALAGVPIVVKDNICTKGIRTTAASRSLEHFIPPYNATVVARLEQADAIILAKSNLDEFGMGGSNENSAFGAARNPWNEAYVPGGSSGGSAAAVAAGVAPLALGTDTGGSVRQPAAFNGLVGFKPTYGSLSRYGVIAFASSLDQVGVLARSNRDVALAMQVMAGHDPYDATSLTETPPHFAEALEAENLQGLRVGIIKELSDEGNSPGVRQAFEHTCSRLQELGAELHNISMPNAKYGIAAYYLVAPAEASSNLARYDGTIYGLRSGDNRLGQAEVMQRTRAQGFGEEVRRRVLIGTYALSAGYYDAYYGKALKVRRVLANDFAKAFEHVDVLLTPTTPSPAYKLGQKASDPLAMYLDDIDTVLANLVGVGGISVPAGFAENNMPCGVEFLAPVMEDMRLLRVSAVLERHLGSDFAPLAPFASL